MKKIILNENRFVELQERLGVPDNIFESSVSLYGGIIEYLNSTSEYDIFEPFSFVLSDKLTISDVSLDGIRVVVNLHKTPYVKGLKLQTIGTSSESDMLENSILLKELEYSYTNNSISLNFISTHWRDITRNSILLYLKKAKKM